MSQHSAENERVKRGYLINLKAASPSNRTVNRSIFDDGGSGGNDDKIEVGCSEKSSGPRAPIPTQHANPQMDAIFGKDINYPIRLDARAHSPKHLR
jgi:hypothetical protein